MKKVFVFVLLFVFILGLSSQVLADSTQAQKIKAYIQLLEEKQQEAKAGGNEEKAAQLEQMINEEKVRLANLSMAEKETTSIGNANARSGFKLNGSYAGGSFIGGIGLGIAITSNLELGLDAGYGIAENAKHSVTAASVSVTQRIAPLFLIGLSADYGNYANQVNNVAGLGTVAKGTKIGGGLFGGVSFYSIDLRVGYSTALGVTAGGSYRF